MLKFLSLAILKGKFSDINFRYTKNKKILKYLSTFGNMPGSKGNTIPALEEIYNL